MADVAARKAALRDRLLQSRRQAPPSAESAEAAARRLVAMLEFRRAGSIGLYAALPDELETGSLFREAQSAGKRVALPRTRPGVRLEFAWCASFEELRPGRYGVPEPPEGSHPAALADLDLLVVPGVAFDRSGGRLGRGAGYYDRLLSTTRRGAFTVGVTSVHLVVDRLPTEAHDEKVRFLATEEGVIETAHG